MEWYNTAFEKMIYFMKKSWFVIIAMIFVLVLIMRFLLHPQSPVVRRRSHTRRTVSGGRKTKSVTRSNKAATRKVSKGKGRKIGNVFYPDTREGRSKWAKRMHQLRKSKK